MGGKKNKQPNTPEGPPHSYRGNVGERIMVECTTRGGGGEGWGEGGREGGWRPYAVEGGPCAHISPRPRQEGGWDGDGGYRTVRLGCPAEQVKIFKETGGGPTNWGGGWGVAGRSCTRSASKGPEKKGGGKKQIPGNGGSFRVPWTGGARRLVCRK